MEIENKSSNLKKYFSKKQRKRVSDFVDHLLWENNLAQTAGFQSDLIDDFVLEVQVNPTQGVMSISPMGAIRLMPSTNELSMMTSISISNIDNLERIEVIKYFMIAILHFKFHVFKLHNESDDEKKIRELASMEDEESKQKLIEEMRRKRMDEIKSGERDPTESHPAS